MKLQREYLLKGEIDAAIITILQKSVTAVKAEVKAHNEYYHSGTGRGETTRTGTGKGIGRDIGVMNWKVKDGTMIARKRVEAKRWMIMTEIEAGTGTEGDA